MALSDPQGAATPWPRRVLGGRPVSVGAGLLLVALNLVLANHLAARHYRRADWTAAQVFTLSRKTIQVVQDLRRPVRVVLFMVPPDRAQDTLYPEMRELLRQVAARSPLVELQTIDIDAEPTRAELLAKKYVVSAADLKEGVVVLESGGRSKYVAASAMADYSYTAEGRRLIAFKGESAVLQALLEVSRGAPLTVCFTRDHGEAPIDSHAEAGFSAIVDEVKRDGYKVRAVDSQELVGTPRGCAVLVLAGPTRAFAPVELDALDRYLRRGGRVFALLGPVLDRRVTRHKRIGLEELLSDWGAQPRENIVVDHLAVPGEPPLMTWATQDGYSDHPIGRALAGKLTVWPLTREVRPARTARAQLRSMTLVQTSRTGWGESDLSSLRGDRPLRLDRGVDTPGPVPVAVAVEWAGDAPATDDATRAVSAATRLVVFGTERGVLNQRLAGAMVRDYDRDLFLTTLAWLAGQEAQLGIGPKIPEHVRLILDERQLSRAFLIAVVALPLCSVCCGLLVWWRRRR